MFYLQYRDRGPWIDYDEALTRQEAEEKTSLFCRNYKSPNVRWSAWYNVRTVNGVKNYKGDYIDMFGNPFDAGDRVVVGVSNGNSGGALVVGEFYGVTKSGQLRIIKDDGSRPSLVKYESYRFLKL